MREANKALLMRYLERHGYGLEFCERAVSGFDLDKPIYESRLDNGAQIFQFVRNPTQSEPMQKLGNWFFLRGASMDGLGIFGGGEGRSIAHVRVISSFTAVEGISAELPRDWKIGVGGTGGLTQIFVPHIYLTPNIQVLGYE